MFSQLRILSSEPLSRTTTRYVVSSEDEYEKRLLMTMNNVLIGKTLNLSNRKNPRVNISNVFPELVVSTSIVHPNCDSALAVIPGDGQVTLLFREPETTLASMERPRMDVLKRNIRELIMGVKYLHSRRIIHGNINPETVVFDENGRLRVSNYSHSNIIPSGTTGEFANKHYVRNYRAPEVWKTRTWGFSADIWALGCTMYYMLYGKDLFPVQNSDDEYITFLDCWENRERTPDGKNITISYDWKNNEYFALNNMIMMMCNPDESKRPTAFEVFEHLNDTVDYKIPMSCSPQSVCRYTEPGIVSCVYDRTHFVSPARTELDSRLTEHGILGLMVLSVYEGLSCVPDFNSITFDLSWMIACSLVGREHGVTVTNEHVTVLREKFSRGMYSVFDYRSFFR
jgi:hypothetical protein